MRLSRIFAVLCLLVGACGSDQQARTPSPIDEFLGFATIDQPSGAEAIERWQRVEELTASCMHQEGFEYTPTADEIRAFYEDQRTDGSTRYSRDWVEQYGFGVSTLALPQQALPSHVVGADPPQPYSDPNSQYVSGLSRSARAEYESALNGEQPSFDGTPSMEEIDQFYSLRTDLGCRGDAVETIIQERRLVDFLVGFGDEVDEMNERIMADSRVAQWNDGVIACMTAKGHVWINEPNAVQQILTRLDAITSELDIAQAALEDPAFDNLATLQAHEIRLALALDDCGGDQLDRRRILAEVRPTYENDFLNTNRQELLAFRDSE